MEFIIPLAFAFGYFWGLWNKPNSMVWARYKLINLALRTELIAMRRRVYPDKNKNLCKRRPKMYWWEKLFLGLLNIFAKWALCYNQFYPKTIQRWSRPVTYIQLLKKISKFFKRQKSTRKVRGRPATPEYIVELVLRIKEENPGYSPRRIANILSKSLEVKINRKTVAKILKEHGYKPNPPHLIEPLAHDPNWLAFLKFQFLCAIDFKPVDDLWGNRLYILCVIDYNRRHLVRCISTYNPTALWISQQIREAFPYDTAPAYIVMDRDCLFTNLYYHVLPNMGITPLRIDYKCPWQNGVVERFILTLKLELLIYLTALSDNHMNRLLSQYQEYYNKARHHMVNKDQPPIHQPVNFQTANKTVDNLESVPWVGGLHHSYRWAA